MVIITTLQLGGGCVAGIVSGIIYCRTGGSKPKEEEQICLPELGGKKAAPVPQNDVDGLKTILFAANDPNNPSVVEELRNEAQILQQLTEGDENHPGHKRIIKLIGWEPDPVTLRMELIEPYGFDMMSVLLKYHKANIGGGTMVKRSFRQLYDALCYLRVHEIVHGDMKCDNVLITRSSDVKLIDFGESRKYGDLPAENWPCNNYIAPEARASKTPADYAQDMYGLYSIFNEWDLWVEGFPSDVRPAVKWLGAKKRESRMTLDDLEKEPWIQATNADTAEVDVVLPTVQSKLPLKSGFAMEVTKEVLKMGQKKSSGCLAGCAQRLCSGELTPVTIGSASLMATGGVQVLYVDRRHRKKPLPPNEKEFVHVPAFGTEIDLGDWMYIGFPEKGGVPGAGARQYFTDLAKKAGEFDTQITTAVPKWFAFDEFPIPGHAIGKCLGPEPHDKLPQQLRDKYANLDPQPAGYLNLRAEYEINLAGVKREGKNIFYPGAVFMFKEGDKGLLVRAENVDGDTLSTHSNERILAFIRARPRHISIAEGTVISSKHSIPHAVTAPSLEQVAEEPGASPTILSGPVSLGAHAKSDSVLVA